MDYQTFEPDQKLKGTWQMLLDSEKFGRFS